MPAPSDKELDNLHISSAESYVELEERIVDLSDSYCILSLGYDRLAEKHDRLLHITSELSTQLSGQAQVLMDLNEWKMCTQKGVAEIQIQDPELLYYGTPHSTPTVDIATGQVESDSVTADTKASRTIANRRDSGVTDIESPLMMSGSPFKEHVVHPRLVLRLPVRTDTEEGLGTSPGGLASDQCTSSKRVRKLTEKRKAAALQAQSTGKKARNNRTWSGI
jgi:hypothetical protein